MRYRTFSLTVYERKLREDRALDDVTRGIYFDGMCKLLVLTQAHKVNVWWSARAAVMWWPDERAITLKRNNPPKMILHDLLHELGHVRLTGEDRFLFSQTVEGCRVPVLLNTLHEEFEAWHAGRVLAQELNIPIDGNMYARSERKNLMAYVAWVARRGSKSRRWV